jgi:hypothetical protein
VSALAARPRCTTIRAVQCGAAQGGAAQGGAAQGGAAQGGGSPSARLLNRVEALPLPLPLPKPPLPPPPPGAGGAGGRGGRQGGSPGAAGGRGSSPKGVVVVSELGRAKGVTMPAMMLAGGSSGGRVLKTWVKRLASVCCRCAAPLAAAPLWRPPALQDPLTCLPTQPRA